MSSNDILLSSNETTENSYGDDEYKSRLENLKQKLDKLSKVAKCLHKTNVEIVKKNKKIKKELTQTREYIQNMDVINITEHENIIQSYKQKIRNLKKDKKQIDNSRRDISIELRLKKQKIEDLKDRLNDRK